jgi:S-formylglutathione hydrolase FrmB
MESYITSELPTALFKDFSELDSSRVSITGHSMGGHGALTLFLKNPGMYKSVSAFAPIANPVNCPWGNKAFSGYFGEDQEEWKKHDATELIKNYKGEFNALIDVVSLNGEDLGCAIGLLMTCREPETTFTSKSNCFQRTFLRQPRRARMIRH